MAKSNCCPTCGRAYANPESTRVPPARSAEDRATLSDKDLYAYYKARAPYDDLAFFLAHCHEADLLARAYAVADDLPRVFVPVLAQLKIAHRGRIELRRRAQHPWTPPETMREYRVRLVTKTACTCGHTRYDHATNEQDADAYPGACAHWGRDNLSPCPCPAYVEESVEVEEVAFVDVPYAEWIVGWTAIANAWNARKGALP